MACFCPLKGYRSKEVSARGKRPIVFDINRAFSPVVVKVPCGQCVGCRLEKSRQWAIRCMHEKKMHKSNLFLTLTYDKAHLPESGSLCKRDLQLFFKRLRKKFGQGVRFYACGEYGEDNGRPHYHAIVFNIDFPDKRFYKKAKSGKDLYTSAILEKIWGNGFAVIGDVDFDSCAYVARYIMKKVTGKGAENYYTWYDLQTGEIFDIQPEYTTQSNRSGGIGLPWFRKYGAHAYKFDSVIMNGREVRPPRYYDTKYELVDEAGLEIIKAKRRAKALLSRADNTPQRLRVREGVAVATLKMKRREL